MCSVSKKYKTHFKKTSILYKNCANAPDICGYPGSMPRISTGGPKAPISQDLSGIPSPFAFEEKPKKKVEVEVKKEMQCYCCDEAIKKNACGTQRPVTCDICHAVYHMSCAKLRFPPKFGSWACESCVTDMIGSQ